MRRKVGNQTSRGGSNPHGTKPSIQEAFTPMTMVDAIISKTRHILIRPTILPCSHPALDLRRIHMAFRLCPHRIDCVTGRHSSVRVGSGVPLKKSDSFIIFLAFHRELGFRAGPCGNVLAEFFTMTGVTVSTFMVNS